MKTYQYKLISVLMQPFDRPGVELETPQPGKYWRLVRCFPRVVVTGGRNRATPEDEAIVTEALDAVLAWSGDFDRACPCEDGCISLVIVEGGATGIDTLAREWARKHEGVSLETFGITRDEWERLGRSAGPRRNEKMLKAGTDLVVAFGGGRGTANCVMQAKRLGIPVWLAETEPCPLRRS